MLRVLREAIGFGSGIKADNEWVLEEDRWLVHQRGHYEIDIETCRSCAPLLDWIFQVLGKSWYTGKTIHDLLLYIEEEIDPQATLCGRAIAMETARVNAPPAVP